ncbi:MAG: hypothetical protein DMF62_06010 [Acidobacteria bacterium]|nr:MAG: hypothetical protein DMF62_06010 [Acidobacteriota bacterium]
MFCPKCGSTQPDDLKFCKQCGANLSVVRKAVERPEDVGKFDWNKTWLAEMLMSGEEAVKRSAEIERLQGLTPEVRRRNEIKAGVITTCIGVGLMVFLYIFMQGVILSGEVKPGEAEILSRIWIAGFIPIMVGLALIINGVIVNKLFASKDRYVEPQMMHELGDKTAAEYLPPADTNELFPAGFSVTDQTTRHLKESAIPRSKTADPE